jgi:hypothetical protein
MQPSDLLDLLEAAKRHGLTSIVWGTERETKRPRITVVAWPYVASGETEVEALANLMNQINEAS